MPGFNDLVRSHGALSHAHLGGELGEYRRHDDTLVSDGATAIVDFDVAITTDDGMSIQHVITGDFRISQVASVLAGDKFICSLGTFRVKKKLYADDVSTVVV